MKVLALVDSPDHVCCRYRIQPFAPALDAAGCSLTVEGLARNPLKRLAQLSRAGRYETVILQRKLLPSWQLRTLRRNARRLLFDFDDAVLYRDSYDPRGPVCPRRVDRFARLVRLADGVLAGNDFLAECARLHGARVECVRTLPTSIDLGRYEPKAVVRADACGPVDLVWIGSSSTLQGLEQRRELLERLGRTVRGLRLRVICDRFPKFDALEVVPISWSESEEARALAEGDIGISLLPDDLWSRGKCGLKVLQYRAVGLPVVADLVGVHPQMIRHGWDGYLPGSDDAWITAVRRLASEPVLRSRMGREARLFTKLHYSVASQSAAFVAAVTGSDAQAQARKFHNSSVTRPIFQAVRRESSGDLSLNTPGANFRRNARWL